MTLSTQRNKKMYVGICIMLLIALLFIYRKPYISREFHLFTTGYLGDILIPFGFYFMLTFHEFKILDPWINKALIVFSMATTSEIAQYFGIYLFGVTFDPLDFAAYATGIALAVLLDLYIFPRIFSFWNPHQDALPK